jgi:hypothetical protein
MSCPTLLDITGRKAIFQDSVFEDLRTYLADQPRLNVLEVIRMPLALRRRNLMTSDEPYDLGQG